MDTGRNLHVLMEHCWELDIQTYNPNYLPSRTVTQRQSSTLLSPSPSLCIAKAGIAGMLFCRIARRLPDDESPGWTFNMCEDCPSGITVHINNSEAFEGCQIHSISSACEVLEY